MYDEDFIKEFRGIVKSSLAPWYYNSMRIKREWDLEDLVQDFILNFLKPTTSGQIRLAYYKESCQTEKHFRNVINLAAKHQIYRLLGSSAIINQPILMTDLDIKGEFNILEQLPSRQNFTEDVDLKIFIESIPDDINKMLTNRLIAGWKQYEFKRQKISNYMVRLEYIRHYMSNYFRND